MVCRHPRADQKCPLQVSLAHWNQDEEYGGFGGPHCMVVGGYGAIMNGLAQKLDVRFNKAVTAIAEKGDNIVVTTADGEPCSADASRQDWGQCGRH